MNEETNAFCKHIYIEWIDNSFVSNYVNKVTWFLCNHLIWKESEIIVWLYIYLDSMDVVDLVHEFKFVGLVAALNSAVMFIHLILMLLFIAWLSEIFCNILLMWLPPYFIVFETISAWVVLKIFYIGLSFIVQPDGNSMFHNLFSMNQVSWCVSSVQGHLKIRPASCCQPFNFRNSYLHCQFSILCSR